MKFTQEDFLSLKKGKDLLKLADKKKFDLSKITKDLAYEEELSLLQTELVWLQQWIVKKNLRLAVIFEGRDASGKGGSIKRFKEHLNPRTMRGVALSKPTKTEQGQWYFRRYIKEMPNPGEMVFFDRSWYNRAVVEPVMGFCTKEQYDRFMLQVPEYEHMLYEDGVLLIKFWFSITKDEQKRRFDSRNNDPLKQWKFSAVDLMGQQLWDSYTHYKEEMFSKTHTSFSPWIIIHTNDKKQARLESLRYVLSKFDYDKKGKTGVSLTPDPDIVMRFYRQINEVDK